MKPGRNPQANLFLARMLKQGLIEQTGEKTYTITEKGREVAAQFRAQPAPMPEQKMEA